MCPVFHRQPTHVNGHSVMFSITCGGAAGNWSAYRQFSPIDYSCWRATWSAYCQGIYITSRDCLKKDIKSINMSFSSFFVYHHTFNLFLPSKIFSRSSRSLNTPPQCWNTCKIIGSIKCVRCTWGSRAWWVFEWSDSHCWNWCLIDILTFIKRPYLLPISLISGWSIIWAISGFTGQISQCTNTKSTSRTGLSLGCCTVHTVCSYIQMELLFQRNSSSWYM